MSRDATTSAWLWRAYGYTYDGLLHFGPYGRLLDQMRARAAIEPGMSVLDLGCGTGNLLVRVLEDQPTTLVGVDSSPSMLATARRKLADQQVELVESDILSFLADTPSGSIDRILLNNVAYTVDDQARLWSEVLRVLAPNGLAVVSNPDTARTWPILRDHLRHYPWRRLLRPKLAGVFVTDLLINGLQRRGQFHFDTQDHLAAVIRDAGGSAKDWGRAYGDTNVIFTLAPQQQPN